MSNSIDRSKCIDALRECAEIMGKSPTVHGYRDIYNERSDIDWPHDETIKHKFGSWNKAKEIAGFDTNKSSVLGKQNNGVPEILDISSKEFNNMNKWDRYRKRNQAKWAKYKMDKGCSNCGYNSHPSALEYHHIDSRDGDEPTISSLIGSGYGDDRIKEELEKCIILCANCHRIETDGDMFNINAEE